MAVQAGHAAQALCRVLAVHAAPVCLFPVGVPAGLRVFIKTPGDSRVVPPVVIILVMPVTIRVVLFPIRIVFSIIPIPLVIVAGVPESSTVVVPIPVARISIVILARVIVCIVVAVTAPSTF